jgi:nitrate/nitrite transport system ATP-binding protein
MWSESSDRHIAPLTSPRPVATTQVNAMSGFLKVEKLAKAYQADKPVFADVSFTIDKGEFVCIIGHSGCGKTTVLNVLAGLDTASSGHCFMKSLAPAWSAAWCFKATLSCPG